MKHIEHLFIDGYWKTFINEDLKNITLQLITVVFIVLYSTIFGRFAGKKGIHQMTLPNVVLFLLFTSTIGTVIQKPEHFIIAIIISTLMYVIVTLFEWLEMKINKVERALVGVSAVIFKDGKFIKKELERCRLTADQVESAARVEGITSMQTIKTITIESNGYLAFELMPQYEPIKKIYFDEAMKQLLKAINNSQYIEAKPPKLNDIFAESESNTTIEDDGVLE